MESLLRLLWCLAAYFVYATYYVISSFVYNFIPKFLRRRKNIKGQRVLITGAGNGVGRALAIEFSKHAACLILVDINRQSLLQTEKLLDRSSPVFIYNCDVSDYKNVYEMAKQVQKDVGDVDILVNNAGVVSGEFLWDLPEEKIIKTMEVNTLAHFWTCKAFLPGMMKNNRGHIVSIISLAGKIGAPKLTDYCASKFAALGFAETLELELRLKKLNGIKITTVCPSFIDTDLFKGAEVKIGFKMSPEYVAKEVINGVLENEEMIILPHYFAFLLKLKELVPRWIGFKMNQISGANSAMDTFVGRDHIENGTDVKNKAKKKE